MADNWKAKEYQTSGKYLGYILSTLLVGEKPNIPVSKNQVVKILAPVSTIVTIN